MERHATEKAKEKRRARTWIAFSDRDYDKFKAIADSENRTMNNMIAHIAYRWLEAYEAAEAIEAAERAALEEEALEREAAQWHPPEEKEAQDEPRKPYSGYRPGDKRSGRVLP